MSAPWRGDRRSLAPSPGDGRPLARGPLACGEQESNGFATCAGRQVAEREAGKGVPRIAAQAAGLAAADLAPSDGAASDGAASGSAGERGDAFAAWPIVPPAIPSNAPSTSPRIVPVASSFPFPPFARPGAANGATPATPPSAQAGGAERSGGQAVTDGSWPAAATRLDPMQDIFPAPAADSEPDPRIMPPPGRGAIAGEPGSRSGGRSGTAWIGRFAIGAATGGTDRLRLLILGMNYAPEPVGVAIYTTGLAEGLAACGHEVTVVAATPWYPAWAATPGEGRLWSERIERGVQVIRCPHPIPARPTAARRILQQLAWAAAATPPLLARALVGGADAVLAVAPAALAAPAGLAAARLAGAPAWLHVQDFEAEAVFGAGLIDPRGRLGRLAAGAALGFEARLLRRFDRVSTISPAMRARLAEKGVAPERARELRNWAEDSVLPLAGPSPYRAEWGLEGRRVALYSGNLGAKQGLDMVLEAARRLAGRGEFEDLVFVICGEGPGMARLEQASRDLPNLLLRPLQPMTRLGELLALADLHLLPQVAGAADLMLPSKLANMLASGRPVLATAAEGTQLAAEVSGCGLITAPGDAEGFAEAIAALIRAPRMRAALGAAARRRALERWDRATAILVAERELRAMAAEAQARRAGLATPPPRPSQTPVARALRAKAESRAAAEAERAAIFAEASPPRRAWRR